MNTAKHYYTVNALSESTGLDRRHVNKILREVEPDKENDSGGQLFSIKTFIEAYKSAILLGSDQGAVKAESEYYKLVKLREEAISKTMENRNLMGDLADLKHVRKEWIKMITKVRSKLLSLGVKAAPLVYGLSKKSDIQKVFDELIREALIEISEYKNPKVKRIDLDI